MKRWYLCLAVGTAVPAHADVVQSSLNGFDTRHVLEVPGTPAQAMARFGNISAWWDPEHSYSGKSENLRLTLKTGDCFCETLPDDGGVEHMRVAYVAPGKRLTMTGGLGPLLYEATAGVMDVQFVPSGTNTKVTISYRVAGFAIGGADKIAPMVDQVLAGQFKRYAALR